MTVAHLIGRWGIGGLEGQLAQVINRLPADRFRHLIVFRNGRNRVGPPVRSDVRILCLDDPPRNRRWLVRLAGVLRRLEVNVVHNRELFTVSDTAAACRLAGVQRMVFSFHGFTDDGPGPGRLTRWRWRRALRRYHARWAVSAAARDGITSMLHLPRDSVDVLRNGVDTERYCPPVDPAEARRQLGLSTDRVVLLAVGNLTTVKNHQLALESMEAAGIPPERCTLVMVGEDRLGGAVQRWAAERLPRHDVRLAGPTDDVRPWYAAADVFVLCSRSEGLCNALLEAMSCGLPIVATDVPGNREVLRDGRTGLLAPVDDPSRFGAALRGLVVDAGLRRRLGSAARVQATTEYDIRRTTEAYARAYERLVVER
jgi:glycosyltransferase involved in cell wall biosynthesis